MELNLRKIDPDKCRTGCLVVGVLDKKRLLPATEVLDRASDGAIARALGTGDLREKPGSTLLLHGVNGITAKRVLLVRLGPADKLDGKRFAAATQAAVRAARRTHTADATILLTEAAPTDRDTAWAVRRIAQDTVNSAYRFDEGKGKKRKPHPLKRVVLHLADGRGRRKLQSALEQGRAIADGMAVARRLGDLPPNTCTPAFLAREARAMANRHAGLSVTVLGEREMRKLGMHCLLSVSAGSAEEAKLIVFEYKGGAKSARPEVLVGKGITFDTGGISLKPGAAMDEMKYDMCGAASVFGAVTTACELELPLNLVGVVAAAENMPSGTATRPGDIVRTLSGQTVEILNTDAEGRLVLCDALTYVERYKPAHVVDMATLTGACVVALGKVVSGLFTEDDDLADSLLAAGDSALDRTWRLPLLEEYQELLDSNFADMANIGGPHGGAITAACFLSRFTRAYSWAHLDIAGVAWKSGAEKGATGRPVALLSDYLLERAGQGSP